MGKHYIESSTIKYVDYDRSSHTLKIAFPDKPSKHYVEVPHEVYDALITSGSPGTYYHDHIEGKYDKKSE